MTGNGGYGVGIVITEGGSAANETRGTGEELVRMMGAALEPMAIGRDRAVTTENTPLDITEGVVSGAGENCKL